MAARATIVSVRAAARTLLGEAGAGRWIGKRGVSAGHVAGNVRALTTATATTPTTSSKTPVDPLYAPDYPAHLPIPGSALAALCARLGLGSSEAMHAQLVVALTDVSYDPAKLPPSIQGATRAERAGDNALLAALGNSLLGLYASEHLATVYPNLPTRALKALVSLHVGPSACFDVARSLGLGVSNAPFADDGSVRGGEAFAGKARKRSTAGAGVPVRWVRAEREAAAQAEGKRRTTWEEVVARSVRALVALVYQEKGIAAARKFVHAHFMSRHVDVASVLSFRHPKHVLSVEVRKLLGQAGAPELAGVQSRILAESGRHSLSPIYNIGLFLPSGLKLAEGYGSSLRMAEHRAARNALVSIYTARGELLVRDHPTRQGERVGLQLPTEVYAPPPPSSGYATTAGLAAPADSVTRPEEREREFAGSALLAKAEALMASAERARGTRR
ncbi:hypothetical protein NliqN6_4568 [Naganishia liquefaciens]|uniref:Large ribosomal subunit protein mL44 n=1 Tax=Naganishia liquefaciens TaxID=104408 RepID=A0A8H3YI30_9TREE|nr:hypothetical protein NliqN6_4568 [Naganishia liquefaciens]